MKRSLLGSPDFFASNPFLALLPSVGNVAELQKMAPSFFARYEKVAALRREMEQGTGDIDKRIHAEEQMIRTVLDWLNPPESAKE
ncbi:MAG: hypothetical protein QY326_00515 [Bdellovibrionota bacterium]|nr:MAG: hypothetical protein QY326_00515 [Bdellovibrionota bacterium]